MAETVVSTLILFLHNYGLALGALLLALWALTLWALDRRQQSARVKQSVKYSDDMKLGVHQGPDGRPVFDAPAYPRPDFEKHAYRRAAVNAGAKLQ